MKPEEKANEIFNNISFGYWEETAEYLPEKIAWRISWQTVEYILQALKYDINSPTSASVKFWEEVAAIVRLKWGNLPLMPQGWNDEPSVTTGDAQSDVDGETK